MTRRAVVNARPLLPPRLSLVLAAEVLQGGDDRWEGGFQWQAEGCGGAGRYDVCLPGQTRDIPDGRAAQEYVPFGVWAGEQCSTFGWSERDWQARAQRLLEACESQQIEAELWRGDIARAAAPDYPNRFLASDDAEVITGGPHTIKDALALLESAIGDCACNGRGWIHAPRQVVSLWSQEGALRREGNLLLTINDTIVVPGIGYDGSGPGAAPQAPADGAVWAYATGPVDIRRGPIEVLPRSLEDARSFASGVDRDINDIKIWAQRSAAATWDGCCHIGVQVDAPLVTYA